MRNRQLTGIILASALVTLDGTATTIALPVRSRVAALAGRDGRRPIRRVRIIQVGLVAFVAGSFTCAVASSDKSLIASKFAQGVVAAFVLPAALAALRGGYAEAAERARILGVWAAWTGVASAAGPLLAGAFVEVWSWRAVFLPSAVAGLVALVLLQREATPEPTVGGVRVPLVATIALMISLGAVAYLLTVGFRVALHGVWVVLPVGLSVTGGVVLARNRHRHVILPAELVRARIVCRRTPRPLRCTFACSGCHF